MFSNATIVETLNLIHVDTNSSLTNRFMKYGIPDDVHGGSSKQERINNVSKYLIENPIKEGILSNSLCFEMIAEIINYNCENNLFNKEASEFEGSKILYRLLRKDGYTILENRLIRELKSPLEITKEENLIYKLLDKHGFNDAKGHLEQALNAYTRGDWAASNGQLRTYIEELTETMAEKITEEQFDTSHMARSKLANVNPPIFYKNLDEWSDGDGVGYFNGFWKRLNGEGPHPGLSNEADCIFRINLVLVSSAEILRRYDSKYT